MDKQRKLIFTGQNPRTISLNITLKIQSTRRHESLLTEQKNPHGPTVFEKVWSDVMDDINSMKIEYNKTKLG